MHHTRDLTTLEPQRPLSPWHDGTPVTLAGNTANSNQPRIAWPASGLHPLLYRLVAGAFFWMLLVFALVFAGSPEATFMVAICAFYFIVYFGTPWLMARSGAVVSRAPRQSFADFLRSRVEIGEGSCSGTAAVFQVLLIPVALATLCTAIGIALLLVR